MSGLSTEAGKERIGTVVKRRYVLVAERGATEHGVRYWAYDLSQLTHVDVVLPEDDRSIQVGESLSPPPPQPKPARAPAPVRSLKRVRLKHEPWPELPSAAGPIKRPTKRGALAVDPLMTVQLCEADLLEASLSLAAVDPLKTLHLSEADLLEVGLNHAPPPPAPDGLAELELQFRRAVGGRRGWIAAGAAVLGLALLTWLALAVGGTGPIPGMELRPATATRPVAATRPAPPPVIRVKPAPAAVARREPPPLPAVEPAPAPPSATVAPPAPAAQLQPKRPRIHKPRIVRRSRRSRRRPRRVNVDALLATARLDRQPPRLLRKTVDPFGE